MQHKIILTQSSVKLFPPSTIDYMAPENNVDIVLLILKKKNRKRIRYKNIDSMNSNLMFALVDTYTLMATIRY